MIKKICNSIYQYRIYIQLESLALQLVPVIFSTIFKINFFILDIFLLLFATMVFIFLKDIQSDNTLRLKMFKIYKWQIIIGTVAIINDFIWSASKSLAIFNIIGIAVMVLVPIALLSFFSKETTKVSMETLINSNFWERFGEENVENGNVRLGIDRETSIPLFLKYKDRFVHMLILGPTGCGKTSQIITPMIYSDLKNHKLGMIVLEPKGDLAEKVFALAKFEGRKVHYFNPILKDCPYFNPLRGNEDDVIENLVTTLKSFDTDSKGYFQDSNENLIRRAVKVIKRLYKDDATLVKLDTLINNVGGEGMKMINAFSKLRVNNIREKDENDAIVSWFAGEYFESTQRGNSKSFEASSGVRNQIQKLISNGYLNKILNPPSEEEAKANNETLQYLDFDKILEDGEVCAICSAQGKLRDLGRFLGFFLILQIQSAVFRRPGNENTRRGCMLYIDEFQTYANSGMADMLTQGRSYRVGCILATQNRALIGMNSGNKGRDFTSLVSTNARNVVIFPGANAEDAKYYSNEFGEEKILKESISVSRQRYGFNLSSQKETVRPEEKYEARYRPTDIIYKDFGEAVVRIIKNNSVQKPQLLKLSFIPKEINDKADNFIKQFNEAQLIDINEEITINDANDEEEGFFSIGSVGDFEEMGMGVNDDIQEYPHIQMPLKTKKDNDISVLYEEESVEDFIDDM